MLTSRSEYRLCLRSDNADRRLTPIGREVGLIDDYRWKIFLEKQARLRAEQERLQTTRIKEHEPLGIAIANDTQQAIKGAITLADLLRRQNFSYIDLDRYGLGNPQLSIWEARAVETEIKYAGYIQRQQQQIEAIARYSQRPLPTTLDYAQILTLSKEAREKLSQIRPVTIGQASQIGGVSPADINALLIYLETAKHGLAQPAIAASR
jgi:tRNA uridine 5-carboxymethylaminomethyl modification enzyme